MFVLPDEYIGSSCVIKTKKNDLLTMGTLHRIRNSYMDITSSRNELPEIPYNLLVKIEVYNSQRGFRVLLGKVYLSSKTILRLIDISEAASDERREFFRINIQGEAIIYDMNHMLLDQTEGAEEDGISVEMIDVSLGGLLFKTSLTFHVGDRFPMRLPMVEATKLFYCIVRREVKTNDGTNGYGCEFQELDMMQEDRLYKYILKRQNEQLKRVR